MEIQAIINKMPCQKIRNYIVFTNGTPIRCKVEIIHTNIVNRV
jgi:hypothetical protein